MTDIKNIKCPSCEHTDFELILVVPMMWQKEKYMDDAIDGGKAIDAYHCTNCRHIMFFATDDHIRNRNWKYYHDKGLG